jgi:hypothetical protein
MLESSEAAGRIACVVTPSQRNGQMKLSLSFPVWLFINQDDKIDFRDRVLRLGGSSSPHALFPITLPVFSTEGIAQRSGHELPFLPRKIDKDLLYEILDNDRSIDYVAWDHGTASAKRYRVEEVMLSLRPSTPT